MNSKRKEKPTQKNREEPPGKPVKKGNGAVFGFQILLSCLLIAGAVLLKTGFPPEYEEVRQRYYLLLNEELSFGNFGKYAAKLFRVNDSADAPDPEAFLPAAEGEGERDFFRIGTVSRTHADAGAVPLFTDFRIGGHLTAVGGIHPGDPCD